MEDERNSGTWNDLISGYAVADNYKVIMIRIRILQRYLSKYACYILFTMVWLLSFGFFVLMLYQPSWVI